jgi:transcriptional regulator with XRE-family HTH domain
MKQRNFIGRLVSRWRSNRRGWTQDVFADKLQLAGWYNATRSTVSKIEDSSLRIDLIQLYCIATALGIRPGDLLAEVDWREQAEKLICFPIEKAQPVKMYGDHSKN